MPNAQSSAFFIPSLLAACFISVTSTGGDGKFLLNVRSISHVESFAPSCNNSAAIYLKDGKKICTIESFQAIETSLASKKNCD